MCISMSAECVRIGAKLGAAGDAGRIRQSIIEKEQRGHAVAAYHLSPYPAFVVMHSITPLSSHRYLS